MKLNAKDKQELAKYLKTQMLMTLATAAPNPWVATVYYAVDKDLNLYFVSPPASKHIKDIEKNNKVACAITDSHTKNSQKKVGIQMQATASLVKGWDRTKAILKIWHKSAPGAEDKINIKNMRGNVITSRVYQIKPTRIKFFNQRLYKETEKTFDL